jgi:hypothetical protein
MKKNMKYDTYLVDATADTPISFKTEKIMKYDTCLVDVIVNKKTGKFAKVSVKVDEDTAFRFVKWEWVDYIKEATTYTCYSTLLKDLENCFDFQTGEKINSEDFEILSYRMSRTFTRFIPSQIPKSIKDLHKSEKWIKANWRRKIKLAAKEIDRIRTKDRGIFDLHQNQIEKEILKPLRLIPPDFSLSENNVRDVLRFPISNRLGNFLTRNARNKYKWIYTKDLYFTQEYKYPIEKVPFRYIENITWNGIYYWWQGFNKGREKC